MNSESVIKELINGKTNILSPIFDELAYLDVEITDKDNCLINLGDNYYLKTKMIKATEIAKRINLEKAKNEHSISKLDDNTFEIRENIASHEEDKKEKEKEKKNDNKADNKNDNKNEKIRKAIEEENRKLLEKIEELNKKMQSQSSIKRLKLKKKEEIVDIVLKKLNSN